MHFEIGCRIDLDAEMMRRMKTIFMRDIRKIQINVELSTGDERESFEDFRWVKSSKLSRSSPELISAFICMAVNIRE